ncbi:MAG: prepilin-type N-terminal cleavage/methylation domain-containing protein [Pirellulaceae bacterium]|nr:prepilin-type N-terminal cleavage/methylation domain-containing protein [Pirellulaceae bacterium]
MRRAFTLIELLLVLSILVVALSVAVPTYESMITARKIFNAAENVRLELQKARLEAIKTGQAQAFRCQIGQTQFSVQSWLKASDSVEASAGATIVTELGQAFDTESTSSGVASDSVDPTAGQKAIEEGVVFATADILNDMRAMSEQTVSDSLQSSVSGWSQPILFYPDGSTTTAHVVLQDVRGRRMAVQIRGLTGEVKILEVASAGG